MWWKHQRIEYNRDTNTSILYEARMNERTAKRKKYPKYGVFLVGTPGDRGEGV